MLLPTHKTISGIEGGMIMFNKFMRLLKEENGQGMTEYGLVLGVIAVGVVGILFALKGNILTLFNKVNNDVANAATAPPS
jgi:pilus assembly protein Flp/PilA